MTLPNILTFLRLFIAPLFLLLFSYHKALHINQEILPYILLILMGTAELSDAFDGYLARRLNQISDLGKILDPMADSICHITYFLAFTEAPVSIPIFLVFIFIYRDSIIGALRTICALQGVALAARQSGKIKSIVQAIASFTILFLMMLHSKEIISQEMLQNVSCALVAIAAFLSLFSATEYLIINRSLIANILKVND